jgi:hypothetical protein
LHDPNFLELSRLYCEQVNDRKKGIPPTVCGQLHDLLLEQKSDNMINQLQYIPIGVVAGDVTSLQINQNLFSVFLTISYNVLLSFSH